MYRQIVNFHRDIIDLSVYQMHSLYVINIRREIKKLPHFSHSLSVIRKTKANCLLCWYYYAFVSRVQCILKQIDPALKNKESLSVPFKQIFARVSLQFQYVCVKLNVFFFFFLSMTAFKWCTRYSWAWVLWMKCCKHIHYPIMFLTRNCLPFEIMTCCCFQSLTFFSELKSQFILSLCKNAFLFSLLFCTICCSCIG